ncbi:MAG: hypothetical protein APR63_14100 [Desulfuromonas sp. SDB]|nr:MAG: hypothetical protein APR63_14100 [Desulfuromonas sp. SDB]
MKQFSSYRCLISLIIPITVSLMLLIFLSSCSEDEPPTQTTPSPQPVYQVRDTLISPQQNWDISGVYSGGLNINGDAKIDVEVMIVFRDNSYQLNYFQWSWDDEIIKIYTWESPHRCIYCDEGVVEAENNRSEIIAEDSLIKFYWGASKGQDNLSITFQSFCDNPHRTAAPEGIFEYRGESYSCCIDYFIPSVDITLPGGKLNINSSGLNFNKSQKVGANMLYQQDYWEFTDYKLHLQANRIIDIYNPASAENYRITTDSLYNRLTLHIDKNLENYVEIILPDTSFHIKIY